MMLDCPYKCYKISSSPKSFLNAITIVVDISADMYLVRSPQPLTRETADTNAATAAASAFMRRQQSNSSLSSAAAAAALRARPMSPTNVAEVQSKRTMRRSPSASSVGGRTSRSQLTRTPSVGSMMERTFRSPSPGRSPRPLSRDVPPVPSLPNTDRVAERRGPILQTQHFQTASQKAKKGQGSWFGAPAAGDLATVRRASSAMQLSSREPPEPRPGSVSPSINFSYPRARAHSPSGSVQSEPADEHTLVYDPNSRRMVPRRDLVTRSQSVREGIEVQPVKKKKKKQPVSRSGSHLSKGTVGRTKAPALENDQHTLLEEPEGNIDDQAAAVRPVLAKKPSIVKEEPEREEQEELSSKASPAAKQPILEETTPTKQPAKRTKKKAAATNGQPKTPDNKVKTADGRDRVPSESPARSTRFASSTDQLVVRHEPPPRSLSPRKSALKHSSPTRAISPSDDGSDASALALNTEEARRKSVRVSWDDRNTVVVGEAVQPQYTDSPVIPSPQTKKPWHGLVGKHTKKDTISVEKDETMSPRPALPSFGSVREKKAKEPEERPLVRPNDRAWSPQPSSTDAGESSDGALAHESPFGSAPQDISKSTAADDDKGTESSSDDSLMDDTSEDLEDSATETAVESQESTKASPGTSDSQAASDVVPTISVSQASPRPVQTEDMSSYLSHTATASEADDTAAHEVEASREVMTRTPTSQMDDIEEEDEAEHYSDAYEDISEVDGDGFMSLDAVLETPADSPQVRSTTKEVAAIVDGAETAKADANNAEERNDWENAKAYWKSLSLEQRRQLEVEALTEAGDDNLEKSNLPSDVPPSPVVKKISKAEKNGTDNSRSYQIQPGTAWDNTEEIFPVPSENGKLRQSMRGSDNGSTSGKTKLAPAVSTSMRKSMRGDRPTSAGATANASAATSASDAGPRLKTSLRERPATADVQPRPKSYHPPSNTGAAAHKRTLSSDSPSSRTTNSRNAGAQSSLRRRGSDSSESSFTRKRAGSAGGHEFRRSMRGSMRDAPAVPNPGISNKEANRFSLRSLSPTGFRRNSVSSVPSSPTATTGFGGGRMRQSLRGESVGATPRKRMSAFGKPSSSKGKKGRGGSRFDDSSDEDDGPLQSFRSRFVDSSSDEEDVRPTSKGRGLPKSLRSKSNRATASAIDLRSSTTGFESPALPDENDDLTQPKRGELSGGLERNRSGRGILQPQQSAGVDGRPVSSRRGSFMSILRRRKEPDAKITRELTESAARRDTKLERSQGELEDVRNNNLHKRGPSWPLPDEGGAGEGEGQGDVTPERPSTAGGPVAKSGKSKFLRRRSASQGMVGLNHTLLDGQPEAPLKKKKFGALRKMLGLND